MLIKTFKDKKIEIRKLSKADLTKVKEFQEFINSLVKEDAQIRVNKKQSLKQERQWLKNNLAEIKARTNIVLVAWHNNKVVGNAGMSLGWGREEHVAQFCIAIKNGYRGIGLGTCLIKELLSLAKKDLKPKPKIIKLIAYSTNPRAIKFYQKLGFKKVAVVPKQAKIKSDLVSETIMLLEV